MLLSAYMELDENLEALGANFCVWLAGEGVLMSA